MKNDFGQLKRKIFIWVILEVLIAAVIGIVFMNLFVDGILQSWFAETFITVCEKIFKIDYDQAVNIYSHIFRDYKYMWVSDGFFVVLLTVFYLALTRFTSYFIEISNGMDKLLDNSDKEIELSPEMDFMEKKINRVKNALEKRERNALEAEQRKNNLVVYLAHDIKTPLTSVIGYISLLDEATDMPEVKRRKYISAALNKAYRLEQLINEFFEITRFNLQTIVLNNTAINLNYMLLQMSDEFYPILEPTGKKVELKIEEQINLYGDADKLARVFNNILKNAINYSNDNSIVEISATKNKEEVIINFTNHGNVIPQNKLNSIFEKFYRLDKARNSSTGGTGLGLAIAKEIVNAHGGIILAKSTEEKTVFTVLRPNK